LSSAAAITTTARCTSGCRAARPLLTTKPAARDVDTHLRERLGAQRREIGVGFTGPGCELVCTSLRMNCEDGCRGADLCNAAQATCVTACGRGGVVRWVPLKPPSGCER